MDLLKNHFYKICFDIGNKLITFTCEIINDDISFITFRDKFGKTLIYSKSKIISVEEIENVNGC
jgi:hypothetical protein